MRCPVSVARVLNVQLSQSLNFRSGRPPPIGSRVSNEEDRSLHVPRMITHEEPLARARSEAQTRSLAFARGPRRRADSPYRSPTLFVFALAIRRWMPRSAAVARYGPPRLHCATVREAALPRFATPQTPVEAGLKSSAAPCARDVHFRELGGAIPVRLRCVQERAGQQGRR